MINDLIFVTGPPGSRWSGISQELRKLQYINNDDLNICKTYKHHLYSGHIGAYFGPQMDYGTWLEDDFVHSKLEKEIKTIWSNKGSIILMSHHWAYYLENIRELYPRSIIITITRPKQLCFDWWQEAGGWNISHPNYSWYQDDEKMKLEISKQYDSIEEYINNNYLEKLSYVDFFKEFDLDVFNNKFDDVTLTVDYGYC